MSLLRARNASGLRMKSSISSEIAASVYISHSKSGLTMLSPTLCLSISPILTASWFSASLHTVLALPTFRFFISFFNTAGSYCTICPAFSSFLSPFIISFWACCLASCAPFLQSLDVYYVFLTQFLRASDCSNFVQSCTTSKFAVIYRCFGQSSFDSLELQTRSTVLGQFVP